MGIPKGAKQEVIFGQPIGKQPLTRFVGEGLLRK